MELIEHYTGYDSTHHIRVKDKINGRIRYFDISVTIDNFKIKIESIGVAKNSNNNYKYITSLDNKYRGYKGEELIELIRADILEIVPREILQFSIDYVYEIIKKEDDWLK